MNEEVLKKLRYKGGQAAVLNAPEGYCFGIENVKLPEQGTADFVLLFVNNAKETEEWVPKAVSALSEDALFWISYPKQSAKVKTDINRDSLWALVQKLSPYRAVSNVAVDEKWSAVRFRHIDKVKAGK